MHMRRSLALVSGALLLTTPLTSCGFDEATERVNTIAVGASDRDAGIDVLGAVIVSAEEGSGTFIATFVNNDPSAEASVESVESSTAEVGEFSPITVEAGQLVNLADESVAGVPVQGELSAGEVVPMTMQVSGGEVVEIDVPVVASCGQYEGLDATASGEPSAEQCEIVAPEGGHG